MPKITLHTLEIDNPSQVQASLDSLSGMVLRWAITQLEPMTLEVVVLQ